MIRINKFRHIAIIVTDYSKMINFYTKIFGLDIIREFQIDNEDFQKGVGIKGSSGKGAHLKVPGNDVELEIFEYDQKVDRSHELSVSNFPGYRHIAFIVEDLNEAYKKLKEYGVEFISEPITVKKPKNVAGFRFVYFKDPENNIVELNQLP